MKPGMQRDMLAAFLLLFDEFEIGSDMSSTSSKDRGTRRDSDGGKHTPPVSAPGNGRKSRRHS